MFRTEKVEQIEELLEILLKRSAREQRLVADEVLTESAKEEALVVLQAMRLVHHEDLPLDGAQRGRIDVDQLVGSEQHMELALVTTSKAARLRARTNGAFFVRKLVLSRKHQLMI